MKESIVFNIEGIKRLRKISKYCFQFSRREEKIHDKDWDDGYSEEEGRERKEDNNSIRQDPRTKT